jgi:hypothetical protein
LIIPNVKDENFIILYSLVYLIISGFFYLILPFIP